MLVPSRRLRTHLPIIYLCADGEIPTLKWRLRSRGWSIRRSPLPRAKRGAGKSLGEVDHRSTEVLGGSRSDPRIHFLEWRRSELFGKGLKSMPLESKTILGEGTGERASSKIAFAEGNGPSAANAKIASH
jgi:hypothetical protein